MTPKINTAHGVEIPIYQGILPLKGGGSHAHFSLTHIVTI